MPTNDGLGFILNIKGENWNSDYSGIIKDINGLNAIIFTLGTNSWEQLTGYPIRVKYEETQIVNIGNFISNKWLMPDKDASSKIEDINDTDAQE